MRILQIAHGIYPTYQDGTRIYTSEIAYELMRQGVSVSVAVPESPESLKTKSDGELPTFVELLPVGPKNRLGKMLRYATFQGPAWLPKLRELIDRTKPNVIHVQHAVDFGLPLFDLLEELGQPVIIALHDYWLLCPGVQRACQGNIFRCAERCCKWRHLGYVGGLATAMTHRRHIKRFVASARPYLAANSPMTQSIFEGEGYTEQLLHQHPLGIDVASFRTPSAKTARRTGQVRIGFIGTIANHKGCHVLAQAFANSRPIDATLHFHGRGQDLYIESLKKLCGGPDVLFHGEFNHGSVATILSELDIVVIPSIWEETYCLVAQEALAARKVVVASNTGGIGDRIIHSVNGFLVPPNDPIALGRELSRIVPLLHKVSANLDFDKGLLDIQEDARRWIATYSSLIASVRH